MPKKKSESPGYDDFRKKKAEEFREASKTGRDIGEIPLPLDWERRKRAQESLLAYCGYFPESFYLPFSDDHLNAIKCLETAVRDGGLFALAMPRGSGKTTLCVAACMWAVKCGYHDFCLLVGANLPLAKAMLEGIQIQLETNDLLYEDFPEICYPIRKLERIAQRRLIHNGNTIRMSFLAEEIILPDIRYPWVIDGVPYENKAASGIIGVSGILGGIRGRRVTRPDGKDVRPSLVLPDDPQTDESARSPSQCAERIRIVNGALLGLAGPDKEISAVMPCTVIADGDMADQVLDRKANPQWHGQRTKLVYQWPDDMTAEDVEGEQKRIRHWDVYAEIRADDMRRDEGSVRCNQYVADHFDDMHRGAVIAWEDRKSKSDLSALQTAINIRLDRGIPAFDAEYQNSPHRDEASDQDQITVELVMSKLNRMECGSVPGAVSHVTAFVDVMHKALYWMVCGWEPDFTGYILDYGTFPDQHRDYFTLFYVKKTLGLLYPRFGKEGAIAAGLTALINGLVKREFSRLNGGIAKIDRIIVDTSDGVMEKTLHQAILMSPFSGVVTPASGWGSNATLAPMSNWKTRPGEYNNHTVFSKEKKDDLKTLKVDTNFWKTFVANRLSVGMGDKGCLSIFGRSPEKHKMLADHLTSEIRSIDEARSRSIEVWKAKANRDNHFFDCLVGCAAGASFGGGCVLEESRPMPRQESSSKSWSEISREKRGAR